MKEDIGEEIKYDDLDWLKMWSKCMNCGMWVTDSRHETSVQ